MSKKTKNETKKDDGKEKKEEEEKGRRRHRRTFPGRKSVLFFGERIFGFILKRDIILPRKQNVSENGKYTNDDSVIIAGQKGTTRARRSAKKDTIFDHRRNVVAFADVHHVSLHKQVGFG